MVERNSTYLNVFSRSTITAIKIENDMVLLRNTNCTATGVGTTCRNKRFPSSSLRTDSLSHAVICAGGAMVRKKLFLF